MSVGVSECESPDRHTPKPPYAHTPPGRVRSFRFPSWENPHISRAYIESQRATLTDRQFRVEYEAEFIDDTNSVFPWADIQAAIRDGDMGGHGDTGTRGHAEVGSIRVAGIDWARYSDYTAVVIVEMANGQWPMANEDRHSISHQPSAIGHPIHRVVALDQFNRMDWHSQVRRVSDLLQGHTVIAVIADQTSVGDPVLEFLREELWSARGMDIAVEGLVFTNQTKREIIDNLAVRLAHREVGIPRDERLIRELQYYEYELTESGNVRTGAARGHHDDCVTALALALQLAPRYGFSARAATSGHVRASAHGW